MNSTSYVLRVVGSRDLVPDLRVTTETGQAQEKRVLEARQLAEGLELAPIRDATRLEYLGE